MEKSNIADLVNLKREERSRYKHCMLCQRCCLLCTSYGDIRTARACEDLKIGALLGTFFIQLKEQFGQQRIHL